MSNVPSIVTAIGLAAALLGFGGCASHTVPLRPMQTVEVWVPDAPTTAPGTQSATSPASLDAAIASTMASTSPAAVPATTDAPATQPGHMITKQVDPNRSTRFIYDANYDNVWKQAQDLLESTGFALDRQDYRLGVLSTRPLASSQFIEFWKPQQSGVTNAMENTVNNQRRYITVTLSTVEGKPQFYEIGIQVIVERESNPSEGLANTVFVQGSGFGRNALTLRSDYAGAKDEPGLWNVVGHDPDLEKKLLDQLFKWI